MLPVMLVVSILCQSAGVGGAALLSPILLLIFPLLGPTYPLASAASSIASALLTECFGFLSGLSGYWRRGLVDWSVAGRFLLLSVPAALLGALVEPSLASKTKLLRGVYATLMIGLSAYMILADKPEEIVPEDCQMDEDDELCSVTARDGTIYTYLEPSSRSSWKTSSATLVGAGLTGLLGVGMGEVVLPQLFRLACMPVSVAAGTSVAVVVTTALTAASIQFITFAQELTAHSSVTLAQALVEVIPWSLVQYTVPGAILGGQVAPWLASQRLLDDETIETIVAGLFGIIGLAFAIKFIVG